MKKTIKNHLSLILSLQLFLLSPLALAQSGNSPRDTQRQEDDLLKQLDYPELQVVPRATERLSMEVQGENSMSAFTLWPYQVSALATLSVGISHRGRYQQENPTEQQKKDSDDAAMAAMGIGGAWLGLSLFYSLRKPYSSSLTTIRAIKGTDKKSELMRERLAEEALEQPAHIVDSLTYLSVGSNFAASLYVLSFSRRDQRYLPAISALLAFTPLVFKSRYTESYRKHQEYKKKIYAPIFGYGLDQNLKPRFQVSLDF